MTGALAERHINVCQYNAIFPVAVIYKASFPTMTSGNPFSAPVALMASACQPTGLPLGRLTIAVFGTLAGGCQLSLAF